MKNCFVRATRPAPMGLHPRELAAWITHMLQYVEQSGTVELVLVHDAEQARINARHLQCTGPTNILSFPLLGKSAQRGESIGTLVLSVDTLLRECQLYGQNLEEHTKRLLAHGLAHLIGFDHGQDMDELCAELEQA